MNIVHETNMPIPTNVGGAGEIVTAIRGLAVGNSIFIEGKEARHMGGYIQSAKRPNPDRTYVSRTVEGGVRIWRTA